MGAKRHHYLPECYLRQFAVGDFVSLFDRAQKEVRRQHVHNTAVVGHLYSIHRDDGSKDPRIEEMLADVDGMIPVVTKQLEERVPISTDLRSELAFLAALMLVRVPDYRAGVERVSEKLARRFIESSYSSVEALRASVEEWQREDPTTSKDVDVEGMFRVFQTCKIRVNPNEALRLMLDMIPSLAESFFGLDTVVLHTSEDNAFLTCDRPLVTMPRLDSSGKAIGSVGILSPGSRQYLPLSNTITVVFADRGTGFLHADAPRPVVKGVNAAVTQFTDRFLIGRDVALVSAWARRGRLAETEPIGGMDLL